MMTTLSIRVAVAALGCAASALAAPPSTDLRALGASSRAQPQAPQHPRDAFLARSPARHPALSPDGRWLAWLKTSDGPGSVWVLDAEAAATAPAPRQLLQRTTADRLHWSVDGRWLFLAGKRAVSAVEVSTGTTRVLTLLDERKQQRFAGVDPVRPAHVLLQEADGGRHRLVRIDVTATREILHEAERPLADFLIGSQGALDFVTIVEAGEQRVLQAQAGGWREILRCGAVEQCYLLAPAGGGRVLMASTLLGGLKKLVELDPATGALRVIHGDPDGQLDLEDLASPPSSGLPLVVTYEGERRRNYGLTPDVAQQVRLMERRFPDSDLVLRGSLAGRWLISETRSTWPWARRHLYDSRTGKFTEVLGAAHPLPLESLAPKRPVRWQASDGMTLHGFLTLPPGRDLSQVPLVVSVHGGPWGHTDGSYEPVTQLLANRGYAVFQPNFRGSTGRGRAYIEAAQGDFGNGRVQQDIVDGTRWLLANGVGDPARVGITGHSFGGYTTLVGLTHQPELFKVGVALAPPSDFAWTIRRKMRADEGEDIAGVPLRDELRARALDPDDAVIMARLTAQSPERNAERVQAPLVLIAGAKDDRVVLKSITHYAARLRSLGKDVTYLVDPDSGHNLEVPLATESCLYLTEELLHRRLGGSPATPPTAELQQYLRRHLLMTGPSLGALSRSEPEVEPRDGSERPSGSP